MMLAIFVLFAVLGAVRANEVNFPFDEFQIIGYAYKNGQPAKLHTLAGSRDHPYYKKLNASICENTYEAIKRKFSEISEGWVSCEMKVVTGDEVVMGVQLSRNFFERLALENVKGYLEEFAETIKGKTGEAVYFGEVKSVYPGLHILIKGKVYKSGVKSEETFEDGKSVLPFGNLFGYTLCGSTSQALEAYEFLKEAWLFCEVKYLNHGEALVDVWFNETYLKQQKVFYKSSCFADSLRPYLETYAAGQTSSTSGAVYIGDVTSILSSEKAQRGPQKFINRKDVRIDGRLYKNGKPVRYNLDVYEPLNETLCQNVYNAISNNTKLTEAWVKCEVRFALGNDAVVGISFCKKYLTKNGVKYSTEGFLEEIKTLLETYKSASKPEGHYFGKVKQVFDAPNVWVEGNTFKDGMPYDLKHLDGKSSIAPYDMEALNLCKRVELAVTENLKLRAAWVDCELKVVQGNQALTDIWLDKEYLTKMEVDYKSSCFPEYIGYYLDRYAASRQNVTNGDIYYGKVNLVYGHGPTDGL